MGKNKLKRFAENETFPHVFQPHMVFPQPDHALKGRWRPDFFKNDNPITLELGCGRAEYTVALSSFFSDRNFIGIDWKGARIWRGAKTTIESGQVNVAFLRILISSIEAFFSKEDKVNEIWITFPDPQPRDSRDHKRLTSPEFLTRYRSFATEHCVIHLKTDSRLMYDYTLQVIADQGLAIQAMTDDLYSSGLADEVRSIKTTYEKIWLSQGSKIKYVRFVL
ncbi:MAG: tRNA (guanosine(46)-N7)-methyltransferase TrmB [Bacteroidota bacterium]